MEFWRSDDRMGSKSARSICSSRCAAATRFPPCRSESGDTGSTFQGPLSEISDSDAPSNPSRGRDPSGVRAYRAWSERRGHRRTLSSPRDGGGLKVTDRAAPAQGARQLELNPLAQPDPSTPVPPVRCRGSSSLKWGRAEPRRRRQPPSKSSTARLARESTSKLPSVMNMLFPIVRHAESRRVDHLMNPGAPPRCEASTSCQMKTSHEGRVRALEQHAPFFIHRASARAGCVARWRRREIVWMAPLDVLRTVWNAFADEDADFVSRDAFDRPIDSEAAPRCELDAEDAQVAPDAQAVQHRIVGRRAINEGRMLTRDHLRFAARSRAGHTTDVHRCLSSPAADTARRRCRARNDRAPGTIRDEMAARAGAQDRARLPAPARRFRRHETARRARGRLPDRSWRQNVRNGVAIRGVGRETRQSGRSGDRVGRDHREAVEFGVVAGAEDVGAP